MKKIFIPIILLFFYQNFSYSLTNNFMGGGGYSFSKIGDSNYTGYNGFFKLLYEDKMDDRISLLYGVGLKYQDVTMSQTTSIGSSSGELSSAQAGLDFGFKYSIFSFTFLLNPYAYYGINNIWTKKISLSSTISVDLKPAVTDLYEGGIGAFFLYKWSNFYMGPAFYYSTTYVKYSSCTDYLSNSYSGNEGTFQSFFINLVIGFFIWNILKKLL